MSGFDTPISTTIVCTWALLLMAFVAWSHWRSREAVSVPYQMLLLGLRLLAGLAVLVLLLQPFRRISAPDPGGFRVALLADCSASMAVRDCDGQRARLDVVKASLDPEEASALQQRLENTYRLRTFAFSDKLRPVRAQPGSVLPGRTALGQILWDCLDEFSHVPLGAVVLLSDGHSNDGVPVSEACKRYRQQGIPITCVGVGERRPQGDMSVRFASQSVSATKGEALLLEVETSSTFDRNVQAQVELTGPNTALAQHLQIGPEAGTAMLQFRVTPWQAGFHTYKVRLQPVEGDVRKDTDIDYVGVRVTEPDVFRVLYLGAHLGWEYKFLRLLTDTSEQFSLATVLQTGQQAYYSGGLPGDERPAGFPQKQAAYNQFDTILLDTRSVAVLPEPVLHHLVSFVEHRGGGLLLFGPTMGLPQGLVDLMPVLPSAQQTPTRVSRLEANPNFVFDSDPTGILQTAAGLPLHPGEPVCFPAEAKRGARAALTRRGDEHIALAAQSYGSGRVAFIGVENTWRWRLSNASGKDLHQAFWQALLVWLGSTSKQRVAVGCDGAKAGLGEAVSLGVDVLGTDFRPAPDARVTCELLTPSGEHHELGLNASSDALGRYTGVFFPSQPGEHTINYRIKLPSEALEHQAHFLARQTGVESADTEYREDVLRDIARLTNGRFLSYRELDTIAELPLSGSVPHEVSRRYWTRSWWLLAAAACMLCADWYCRRRIGLK